MQTTRALLQRAVDARDIPGAVFAGVLGDTTIGPEAVGTTSFFEASDKVTPETIYDLASLTKVVATTTVLLRLLELGDIRLDDKVSFFLPHTPTSKQEITLRHLLTHTSGLAGWLPLYQTVEHPRTVGDYILTSNLVAQPGQRVEYSCLGYILLGAIIEQITDEPLAKLANEWVFEPLGMDSTCFTPPPNLYPRIAYTEWCPVSRSHLRGTVHDENARFLGGVAGNAGLFSTGADLRTFCRMLLNEGAVGSRQILHPRTVALIHTLQTAGLNEPRSIGWMLKSQVGSSAGDLLSNTSYGHTGFTGTSIWIDPTVNGFFLLLTNRVHPKRDNNSHIRLRPLFHNTLFVELSKL